MIPLGDRRLYLCTPARTDLAEFLEACITGGVDIVQLRDKHLDTRPLVRAAAVCREVCSQHGVPFIMNDRPDLALEVGADGVHVGQDDASVEHCRKILGDRAIVGLSTHAPDELADALTHDATYISAGPVVATPTKPGRVGTGLGYATLAIEAAEIPVFVTGGVTPENVPHLAQAGVSRFVVVRALTEATKPHAAAVALRTAIDDALSS